VQNYLEVNRSHRDDILSSKLVIGVHWKTYCFPIDTDEHWWSASVEPQGNDEADLLLTYFYLSVSVCFCLSECVCVCALGRQWPQRWPGPVWWPPVCPKTGHGCLCSRRWAEDRVWACVDGLSGHHPQLFQWDYQRCQGPAAGQYLLLTSISVTDSMCVQSVRLWL